MRLGARRVGRVKNERAVGDELTTIGNKRVEAFGGRILAPPVMANAQPSLFRESIIIACIVRRDGEHWMGRVATGHRLADRRLMRKAEEGHKD